MAIKHLSLSLAALSLALATQPLFAQDAKPAGDAIPIMSVDRDTFLKVVTGSNEFEIRSSELAREKASDAGLKEAADMIIADHQKAGEKLAALGGDAVPKPALAPKQKKMLNQLEAASGNAFDTLYLDMQAQAHMEAIGLSRTFAGSGDDQKLVGFARETLPTLETHMAHMKMLIAKN